MRQRSRKGAKATRRIPCRSLRVVGINSIGRSIFVPLVSVTGVVVPQIVSFREQFGRVHRITRQSGCVEWRLAQIDRGKCDGSIIEG